MDSSGGKMAHADTTKCARRAAASRPVVAVRRSIVDQVQQGSGGLPALRGVKAYNPGYSPVFQHAEQGARAQALKFRDLGAGGVAAVHAYVVGGAAAHILAVDIQDVSHWKAPRPVAGLERQQTSPRVDHR